MCVLGRDIPVLSLLPQNLSVCSGACHESLEKSIGHQPQRMVLVPPTR